MNKMKTFGIITSMFLFLNIANGQKHKKDPILLTIGNKKIPKSEFDNIYNKNNNKDKPSDEKSAAEYLELFINFKLKVTEAEELGLDSTSAFKTELQGYRKQLAQPYLTDNEVTESLIQEAYERMKFDVNASHILLRLDENALPKDTIEVYNKIMKIYDRISKGEDFSQIAKVSSEDPSAKENGGDLGYFTALQMVYPFENLAFNTEVGQVSKPVRTKFGYHLIKVNDKRQARGQVQVAHIMIKLVANASAQDSAASKAKIDEIHSKLKQGADFAELAQNYSDDRGSAKKGGELPPFGTGRMVPEFENVAFGLPNQGDISSPFLTRFGWHIVKKIDKKGLASFDEMKSDLKLKVSKDSRSYKSRVSLVNKIKSENDFKANLKSKYDFIPLIDSSFFEGKWNVGKAENLKEFMFSLNDKIYSQVDFANYLNSRQSKQANLPAEVVINKMYESFLEESCIAFEENNLESKYSEFKALMQEYRDGILLFELTDQKVWSKAVKDTIGLEDFYSKNKDKFMWEERIQANIYSCANEEIAKKTRKLVEKSSKKGLSSDDILKKINSDSQLNLQIESGKFLKKENEIIDKISWEVGLTENIQKDNKIVFVDRIKKLNPEPKSLNEAKGIITAEYQNYLEKQWIESLRLKYSIQVNQDVFSKIK